MALVDLIYRKVTLAKVGVVQFDCSLSETHSGEATVTDHPVEQGANVSDHIRPAPESVEINGLVSNTPLFFLATLTAPSPLETDALPEADRAFVAYQELKWIKDNGVVVDVVTSLREYENMAIISLAVTRDMDNGNVLNCAVGLRQIIIAQTETIQIPEPVKVANRKTVDKGKKVKKAADAKQDEKAKSTAATIWDSVGKAK